MISLKNAKKADLKNPNYKRPKLYRSKSNEAHTDNRKFGTGTYYGTGWRQSLGRVRGDTLGYHELTEKQKGTPPRQVSGSG